MFRTTFIFALLLPLFMEAQEAARVKLATSFIYVKDNVGNPVPNGTCFFVSIPSKTVPNADYVYLVTAKHVLQNKNKDFFPGMYVRLNTIDTSIYNWVELYGRGSYKNIYIHPDSTVDIAVIQCSIPAIFKYATLDTTFILNRPSFKSLPILEGTEVFFTGLFTSYTGSKKLNPIARFGHISLLPEEKINILGTKIDMILIEATSFGGNSGSPVYFKYLKAGREYLALGGILSGGYTEIEAIGEKQISLSNSGITGVVPAYLLHEILYSREVAGLRK